MIDIKRIAIRAAIGHAGIVALVCGVPAYCQSADAGSAPPGQGEPRVIPTLSFVPTSGDRHRYFKYFYFHKAGLPFEKARQDLLECNGYGESVAINVYLPRFYIPDDAAPVDPKAVAPGGNAYGLIGYALAAMIEKDAVFEAKLMSFRMCMIRKGYLRYGLSKELWLAIGGNAIAQNVDTLARIASGTTPPMEPIAP